MGVCQAKRFHNCVEGLRLPATQFAVWAPAEVCLAARGELSGKDSRRIVEEALGGNSHLCAGCNQVPLDAPLSAV